LSPIAITIYMRLSDNPTIEELKKFQHNHPWMLDRHVVWLGPTEFRIAHTRLERESDADLQGCPLHVWLYNQDGPPHKVGVYVVSELADNRWDFWPILDYDPAQA
jgi:hypothetical protein